MKIITNTDSNFFLKLLEEPEAKEKTKEIKIAVYVFDSDYLKKIENFCNSKIPLSFYWQKIEGFKKCKKRIFIQSLDLNFYKKINCIKTLHSKIYWFLGYGVYIGSANLYKRSFEINKECGLWFSTEELSHHKIKNELNDFFKELDKEELDKKIADKYKKTG